MFKFGCSTVIELEDAITFARIFGLKTDRPTLRRIARASAICHHRLVKSEDVCTFLVRSQNQPEKKYQVALGRQGWSVIVQIRKCRVSTSLPANGRCTATRQHPQ